MPAPRNDDPRPAPIRWRGTDRSLVVLGVGVVILVGAVLLLFSADGRTTPVLMLVLGLLLIVATTAPTTLDEAGIRQWPGRTASWSEFAYVKRPGPWTNKVVLVRTTGYERVLPLPIDRTKDVAALSGLTVGEPKGFVPCPTVSGPSDDPDRIYTPTGSFRRGFSVFFVGYAVIQVALIAVRWATGDEDNWSTLIFAAAWLILGALALRALRTPVADRQVVRAGSRRVPWSRVAYVETSSPWSRGATAVDTDGSPHVTSLPSSMAPHLARLGRVPYGSPDDTTEATADPRDS